MKPLRHRAEAVGESNTHGPRFQRSRDGRFLVEPCDLGAVHQEVEAQASLLLHASRHHGIAVDGELEVPASTSTAT